MPYDGWRRQRVNVADIDLDPENIRLDVDQKTQDDLMADLFTNEDAMEVLESIARNGIFPDEQPIVIKDGERYVMMEGNRRLAAMKALNNPNLIKAFAQKISLIAATFPGINEIEVQVAPGRDEVQRHLANRHTNVTRKAWSPLRQAYFYTALLKNGKTVKQLLQEFPGVDIQKFVRNWDMHQLLASVSTGDAALDKKVRDQRKFPITVLSRLVDDKAFQAEFGISFDSDGHLKITGDRAKLDAVLAKIARDIVDKSSDDQIDTRKLNDDKLRAPYIDRLKTAAQSPTKPTSAAGTMPSQAPTPTPAPTPAASAAPTPATISPTLPPTLPSPGRRRVLAPADMTTTLTSVGVQRMLYELQTINHHKFPIAAHDMLRSFLECSLKAYFKHKNHTVAPNRSGFVQLDGLLADFTNLTLGLGDTGTIQVANRIRNKNSWVAYSATFLNATNHNQDIFPTPTEVEDAWDGMDPLLRYILNP
jgi:hypothetical protein